jgi:hypothetical protein
MAVVISEGVEKKLLEKHDVTRREVIQCLENRLFTALNTIERNMILTHLHYGLLLKQTMEEG